ncbi:MAG: hypothetical protein HN704_14670 [Bacteroidetes bacterium]|jgi:hypothetical protein|nr:hypothetical protein [Bacteroidota bacterium]MBT7492841.1 hypothetical protein [Bacteroidota bacterium]
MKKETAQNLINSHGKKGAVKFLKLSLRNEKRKYVIKEIKQLQRNVADLIVEDLLK